MHKKTTILILCTGNSCRSQMAEGYFRKLGADNIEAFSAGTEAHGLNNLAVKVMQEDEVDISAHTSDTIDQYQDRQFDFVITVCDKARENCPWFPGKAVLHHSFPDPAGATGNEEEVLERFREVRDQIREYVRKFIEEKVDVFRH